MPMPAAGATAGDGAIIGVLVEDFQHGQSTHTNRHAHG